MHKRDTSPYMLQQILPTALLVYCRKMQWSSCCSNTDTKYSISPSLIKQRWVTQKKLHYYTDHRYCIMFPVIKHIACIPIIDKTISTSIYQAMVHTPEFYKKEAFFRKSFSNAAISSPQHLFYWIILTVALFSHYKLHAFECIQRKLTEKNRRKQYTLPQEQGDKISKLQLN